MHSFRIIISACVALVLAGCASRPINAQITQVGAVADDVQQLRRHLRLPISALGDLRTSFALSAEDVDRLREVAGRVLRQSPEFEALLRDFGGSPRK